jgi:hypothetical protein
MLMMARPASKQLSPANIQISNFAFKSEGLGAAGYYTETAD